MTTEALVPTAVPSAGGEIVLPQVIVDAGPAAVGRFLEFFAGADREREDAGGVRASRRVIPQVVRGARPPAARGLPGPRSACSATGSSSTRSPVVEPPGR